MALGTRRPTGPLFWGLCRGQGSIERSNPGTNSKPKPRGDVPLVLENRAMGPDQALRFGALAPGALHAMRVLHQSALALCGLFLLILTADTQEPEPFTGPDDALAVVPTLVRDALLEGRTEDALEALEQLDEVKPEDADFWALLRVTALTEGGKLAQAVEAAAAFETDHRDSAWLAKVRFHRADSLRRLRRFEAHT